MSHELMRLALYGDSLALPRPGCVLTTQRYLFLIEQWFRDRLPGRCLEIKDRARGGILVGDLLEQLQHDNSYFEFPADLLIVHCGVVDCAPRPVNRYVRGTVSRLPGPLRKLVVDFLHRHRAAMIKLFGGAVRTRPGVFLAKLSQLLQLACQRYTRVYVINICPTNAAAEDHSPGFGRNILRYNDLIAQAVQGVNSPRITLLDLHGYLASQPHRIDDFVLPEDGHHITPATHRWIADRIIEGESELAP